MEIWNGEDAIALARGDQRVPATMPSIPSTKDPKDPIAWRQWHHWNLLKECAVLDLPKGVSVLTVHINKEGNMNLCTLEFKKK
jgi:hypothetical protein